MLYFMTKYFPVMVMCPLNITFWFPRTIRFDGGAEDAPQIGRGQKSWIVQLIYVSTLYTLQN